MKHHPKQPGLFITATDTEVGKTIITCAIAAALHQRHLRVGICKPIASDCHLIDNQLVSDDAVALKVCSQSPLPLELITPVRYLAPLSPATAAQQTGHLVNRPLITAAIKQIQNQNDIILIEGIGGIAVPINPEQTVLDLAIELNYPVLVVTRPNLGTLNHTAMTCQMIRSAGLPLAGLIINHQAPNPTLPSDISTQSNAHWLQLQNQTTLFADIPYHNDLDESTGQLPASVIQAMNPLVDWLIGISQ